MLSRGLICGDSGSTLQGTRSSIGALPGQCNHNPNYPDYSGMCNGGLMYPVEGQAVLEKGHDLVIGPPGLWVLKHMNYFKSVFCCICCTCFDQSLYETHI